MLFSVIIPTCNRNDTLGECLRRLAAGSQTLPSTQYEVIVTDDGDGDGAATFCKENFPFVGYTRGQRKGPAANRNRGAQFAAGSWLVFTDDDCLPSEKWLSAFNDTIYNNFLLVALEGKVMADRAQRHFLEESLLNLHGGLFWACNIAILKPLFIEMNCFSEYYPHASMENVDFRERLLQKGIKIEFVPEALIIHPWLIQDHPLGFQWKRYIAAMLLASRHEKMKKRIPPYFYFHAGIFGLAGTFLHAIHFRFRGFVKKVYIDFLQFYFAAHTLVSSVRTIK